MKMFFWAAVVLLIVVLRLNLPENDVAGAYKSAKSEGVVGELAGRFLLSDTVADWQYRDYLLVKYACSERLQTEWIALPFQGWKEHRNKVQACGF